MKNGLKIYQKIPFDDLMFYFVAGTFFLLPAGTAPPLIGIGLAIICWVLSGKIFQVKRIVMKLWFFPVILFVALPWIGLLYSKNLDLGIDYALKTKYWLIVFISAAVELDKKRIDILIMSLWAGLLIGVFLAFIQWVGIMAPIRDGMLGFGIVHTMLSMYLIVGILTASFYFRRADTVFKKIGIILMILALVFHLGVLYGRNGYFIFILLSPLIIHNLTLGVSVKKKITVWVVMIVFFMSFPLVRQRVVYTVDLVKLQYNAIKQGEEMKHSELLPRYYIMSTSVKLFTKNPVVGIGTGSLRYYSSLKNETIEHPHNNILYMGLSFGVFGIFACLWLFWKMFQISWGRRQTPLGFLVLSICLVIFLGGFLNTHILNTGTLILLALGYGMINHLLLEKQSLNTTKG